MGLREFGPKYLEIGSVLLHVLLHAQAELLDPLPLGVHGSTVGLWKTQKRTLEKGNSQPGEAQEGHRSQNLDTGDGSPCRSVPMSHTRDTRGRNSFAFTPWKRFPQPFASPPQCPWKPG